MTACRAYTDRAYLSVVWEVLQWLESASCVLLVGFPALPQGRRTPAGPFVQKGILSRFRAVDVFLGNSGLAGGIDDFASA